jgi:hypothetical protein
VHLRKRFADDPGRGERLTAEAGGVFLDYSKNHVTDETLGLVLQLAEACGLRQSIDAMYRGAGINVTENRAVLHADRPAFARRLSRNARQRRRAKFNVCHPELNARPASIEQELSGKIIVSRNVSPQSQEAIVMDGSNLALPTTTPSCSNCRRATA